MNGVRKRSLQKGYACDSCGKELFDYPLHRLCAECEDKLKTPLRPCPKCGREGRAAGICADCKAMMPKFTRGVAPFMYKGEGASFVNRLKNGNARLAAYLGERMAECFFELKGERQEPILLVAVPATEARKQERGYNQAELLAESVYERLLALGVAVELNFTVLGKTKECKQQKHGTRKERAKNVQGAYHVHKRKACRGRTVVLVDDILTTGATGSECAARLFGAGAKEVYFLVATALPENE